MIRITTGQMIKRRIVKNAIQRMNRAYNEFGDTETIMDMKKLLNEYGLTGYTPTNAQTLDKYIDYIEQNFDESAFKQLENVYTIPEIYNIEAKKQGLKRTKEQPFLTKEQKEELRNTAHLRYEFHEWLESNLSAVYNYEKQHGNVVSGEKDELPPWEKLEEMRNAIETEPQKYVGNATIYSPQKVVADILQGGDIPIK